jgi:hypothetical protein
MHRRARRAPFLSAARPRRTIRVVIADTFIEAAVGTGAGCSFDPARYHTRGDHATPLLP